MAKKRSKPSENSKPKSSKNSKPRPALDKLKKCWKLHRFDYLEQLYALLDELDLSHPSRSKLMREIYDMKTEYKPFRRWLLRQISKDVKNNKIIS